MSDNIKYKFFKYQLKYTQHINNLQQKMDQCGGSEDTIKAIIVPCPRISFNLSANGCSNCTRIQPMLDSALKLKLQLEGTYAHNSITFAIYYDSNEHTYVVATDYQENGRKTIINTIKERIIEIHTRNNPMNKFTIETPEILIIDTITTACDILNKKYSDKE
jgi:hypothetical protein